MIVSMVECETDSFGACALSTHVEQPSGNTIAPSQIFEGVDFLFLFTRSTGHTDTRQAQKKEKKKNVMRNLHTTAMLLYDCQCRALGMLHLQKYPLSIGTS